MTGQARDKEEEELQLSIANDTTLNIEDIFVLNNW